MFWKAPFEVCSSPSGTAHAHIACTIVYNMVCGYLHVACVQAWCPLETPRHVWKEQLVFSFPHPPPFEHAVASLARLPATSTRWVCTAVHFTWCMHLL